MSTPLAGAPTSATPRVPASAPAGAAGELADRIATAVLAVDGVAALHADGVGVIATYLPGRRVAGVAVREDGSTEVAVAALSRGLSTDLPDLARRVQRAVAPLVGGPVTVTVADVIDPADVAAHPTAPALPAAPPSREPSRQPSPTRSPA